jgi:hypothetical protein
MGFSFLTPAVTGLTVSCTAASPALLPASPSSCEVVRQMQFGQLNDAISLRLAIVLRLGPSQHEHNHSSRTIGFLVSGDMEFMDPGGGENMQATCDETIYGTT